MSPTTFAVIGATGWRAQFFLRVAHELPERFRATGLLVRDPERGEQVSRKWGVPAHTDLDALLRERPDFVLISVPWSVSPVMHQEMATRGLAVLAETPPAPDVDGLGELFDLVRRGARFQVAEQLQWRPLHAARITLANSGRLGRVTHAQVAAAHGYHGISLMRRYLQAGFDDVTITGRKFEASIIQGGSRSGPPEEEKEITASQILAQFDFGDRLGSFDFTGAQYHGIIRESRTLIRGERGEINNREVRYLLDYKTPAIAELTRHDAGHEDDLRGYYHEGISLGAEWIYHNPFVPARLSDDEIAVATCMQKMAEYVQGGPEFYSLAEGAQDHYLSMMMNRAVETGEPVRTERQVWAS
jgi:predicted dehydrogenase